MTIALKDFVEKYNALAENQKMLVSCFILVVEETNLDNLKVACRKTAQMSQSSQWTEADCKKLAKAGLLQMEWQYYSAPLSIIPHIFPQVYKALPQTAVALHNHYLHLVTLHRGLLFSNRNLKANLRLLMMGAMGGAELTSREFKPAYFTQDTLFLMFKSLIVNPDFYPVVHLMNPETHISGLLNELIQMLLEAIPLEAVREWLGSYNRFFGESALEEAWLSKVGYFIYCFTGAQSENPKYVSREQIVLKELLESADLSSVDFYETTHNAAFKLKKSKRSYLPAFVTYTFLLQLLAHPHLAMKVSDKISQLTTSNEFIEYAPLLFLVLNFKDRAHTTLVNRFLPSYGNRNWDDLLVLMVAAWLLDYKPNSDFSLRLEQEITFLSEAGYYLPARELAWISNTVLPKPMFADKLAALNERFTFSPVVSRIRKRTDYEIALDALIALSRPEEKVNPDENRIVYFLDAERRTMNVYQQKRKGEGWSAGKKVSMRRFFEVGVEGMSTRDKDLAQTISRYDSYYGPEFRFSRRSWPHFVDHPAVFDVRNPGIPLKIVNHKPSLIVDKSAKSYSIRLDVSLPSDPDFPLVQETENRWLYIEADAITQKVSEVLSKGSLQIPAKEGALVATAVSAVSQHLNVISGVAMEGVSSTAAEVEPDSRLRVLLLPAGDGLRAQIYTKPFSDFPPYCQPGLGGAVLFTRHEKNSFKVTRNFETESANLEQLLNALNESGLTIDDQFSLLFPDPLEALVLLDVLKQLESLAVVEWPEGVRFQVNGRVGLNNLRLSVRKKGAWFDVEGELQVNEELVVSLKELLSAPRTANQRFIELSEGQFIALSDALRRKIDEMNTLLSREKKALTVSSLAIPHLLTDGDSLAKLTSDKASQQVVDRYNQAMSLMVEVPDQLEAELRPYQEEGFRWMTRLGAWEAGACLADDMGLGKTVQSLALLLFRARRGASLVVCPASVLPNWVSEAQRFAPTLRILLLSSNGREETLASLDKNDVLVTTYGLLQSESELFATFKWNVVILDEAHVIKNHTTKTFSAATALNAQCRVALTGTPVQNRPEELWSIFSFLNPGLLGSFSSFQSRFAAPISQGDDNVRRGLLKKIISPFILRRLKQNVLEELPPKTEIVIPVTLSPGELAFYEALRRQALENISNGGETGAAHIQALSELTKLRLACCNAALINQAPELPSSKQEAFIQLVDEIMANRHRSLVFSQFTSHLAFIRKALDQRGIQYLYLDGTTPVNKRGILVSDFQKGSIPLFLISLKAGGLGLNLTGADFVVHLDPWWNPAVEDQATDRAHRIGQSRPVTVYRLVAADTIEEKIIRLHHTKRELAESLLEGADAPQKVNLKELIELISG